MYSPSNDKKKLFLQKDSGPRRNGILIFSQSKSLGILENSDTSWHI